jgi:hypothetical protein
MKWLFAVFLLAVSLAFGVSALAVANPWPFDQRSLIQPIHYVVDGNPLAHARHTWRL